MKIFVDANILISVLNKEYPLFTYSSRIISLADSLKFEVVTSPVCLAIAYYFAEKKFKAKVAKDKIALLVDHITIADTTSACVDKSIKNKLVIDFEDGLEYYTATNSNCSCIVTENVEDFYFSEIEVLKSQDFFQKYLTRQR